VSKSRTFLVVDDNADNRILMNYALRKAFPGALVIDAEQIDEALQAACEARPDAILTDHHLGTGDGASFMQHLAAAGVRCPVVMVTSSIDPAVAQRAYTAGATHVFAGADSDFVGYFKRLFARPPA
jgi:CheY-like chemotaxis protein